MNEHDAIQDILALAASGSLDPAEYRKVQNHTAACESCRQELERWGWYARSLQRLPRPPVPADLVQRTQARMLAVQAAATHARDEARAGAWTLGLLAAFGWATSIAFWTLVEVFTGFDAVEGLVASTLLAWLTAGSTVVMFRWRSKPGKAL